MERKYELENVEPILTDEVFEGLWIVLHKINRVPPHLGLIVNGKYYSLTVNGLVKNFPAGEILENSVARKSKDIFVQILYKYKGNLSKLANGVFNESISLEDTSVTCLFPIREFLSEVIDPDLGRAKYIFEILKSKSVKTGKILQSNCGGVSGSSVFLPEYDMKTIRTSIDMLNDVQQKPNSLV